MLKYHQHHHRSRNSEPVESWDCIHCSFCIISRYPDSRTVLKNVKLHNICDFPTGHVSTDDGPCRKTISCCVGYPEGRAAVCNVETLTWIRWTANHYVVINCTICKAILIRLGPILISDDKVALILYAAYHLHVNFYWDHATIRGVTPSVGYPPRALMNRHFGEN